MNILIALVGTSPAVVTETLWALANPKVPENSRFLPDKLVLITTEEGKKAVELRLLATSAVAAPLVKLAALVGASQLAEIGNGLEIRVPQKALAMDRPASADADDDANDDEADGDVHSQDELGRMGDLIFSSLHEFTSMEDSRVCVSISGGRKTMSHLAGTAMAMLARPHDFMTHVLLEPPELEHCVGTEFFYPSFTPQKLMAVRAKDLESGKVSEIPKSDIRVKLSVVPFVRLSKLKDFANVIDHCAEHGFAASVANANDQVNPETRWTLVYKKQLDKVFLNGKDLEDMVYSTSKKKVLHASGPQIAALRAFARPEGMPQFLRDEADFHLFMRFWSEYVNRHSPSKGKWLDAYVATFKTSHSVAETAFNRMTTDPEDRQANGSIVNGFDLVSHTSRLVTAIKKVIGPFNDTLVIQPLTGDKPTRYRLSRQFKWKEES